MTTPPPVSILEGLATPRALRADPPVSLRPAGLEDAAALRAFYIAQRRPEFAAAGLPEDMLAALLDSQFRAQQMGYAGRFPGLSVYVLTSGGALAGRLMLARETRPAPDSAAVLRVVDIMLADGWRGQGLGRAVLALVEAGARAEGLSALLLDVAFDNPRARHLYEHLGFVAEAQSPEKVSMSLAMHKALA